MNFYLQDCNLKEGNTVAAQSKSIKDGTPPSHTPTHALKELALKFELHKESKELSFLAWQ